MSQQFPLEALPQWQRAMVEAVAAATKTDPSIAGMMSLAALSAAVGRKAIVKTNSELTPPVNIWVLVVMGTGQAKSPVFRAMVNPIVDLQRGMQRPLHATGGGDEEHGPVIRPTLNAWDVLLEDPLGTSDDSEAGGVDLEAAVRAMQDEQRAIYENVGVDFLRDDITPAALVEAAGSQVSGIAWFSPEGGLEAWIGSGARGTNNMRSLNKAWDGDDIREGRVGGGRVAERPCLTIGVMLHPDAADAILRNQAMTSRGYAYRFLVLVPEGRVGGKEGPFERIPAHVAERYRRCLWSMFALPSFQNRDDSLPWEVRLSADANAAYWEFYNQLQSRIALGGDLHDLHGWVEKMCQSVIRMAGLLHLAEHAPSRGLEAYGESVDETTMRQATSIGMYLLQHARMAFCATAATGAASQSKPSTSDSQRLLLVSLVDALVALASEQAERRWTGTPTELLDALNERTPDLQRESNWPGSVRAIGRHIEQVDVELRRRGVSAKQGRSGTDGRWIELTLVGASTPSTPSTPTT